MSNVWSGITENAIFISEGAKVAVGYGVHTLFWDHSWATNKPLRHYATTEVPHDIEGATVEEIWDKVYGWKWDVFAN